MTLIGNNVTCYHQNSVSWRENLTLSFVIIVRFLTVTTVIVTVTDRRCVV